VVLQAHELPQVQDFASQLEQVQALASLLSFVMVRSSSVDELCSSDIVKMSSIQSGVLNEAADLRRACVR